MRMSKNNSRKLNKFIKALIVIVCVFAGLIILWTVSAIAGRVNANAVIPQTAPVQVHIHNPVHLVDSILSHESLPEILALPDMAPLQPLFSILKENPVLENPLLRFAARGSIEAAYILPSAPQSGEAVFFAYSFIAAWDSGLFSPALRILPLLSGFVNIPGLYYVQAGKNSRFEYRMENMTLYIGPYRNLLIITDDAGIFESRSASGKNKQEQDYKILKPSNHDISLKIVPELADTFLADQDTVIADVMRNIVFNSPLELGLSVSQKKIDVRIASAVSSHTAALNRFLQRRSQASGIAERLPAASQYATILSAGTLNELYQAALVFTGRDSVNSGAALENTFKRADSASRTLLNLSLDDLLFSWTGDEFAAFALEGRPHPVYAIQISDERKRQQIFDRAFKTILLNENISLNLDGARIPRIEIPEFLISLLKHWDIRLPSPYYTIQNNYLLASESADALLAAQRAMQKNDVLPKTAVWKNIAGTKSAAGAVSLYYSLDFSVPFFLKGKTAVNSFLSLYRQGLFNLSFNRGQLDISLALIPGFGSGISLVPGYPLAVKGNPSNRIYGGGENDNGRIFFSAGNSALSLNLADNSVSELAGQNPVWVIPADGIKPAGSAWVVSTTGRVTLVNSDMETADSFPRMTGLRISSAPASHNSRLYLCDEDGGVCFLDASGNRIQWETQFDSALRSPPAFLSVSDRSNVRTYAAAYPKSFFGEIWLLDSEGRTLPGWPVPVSAASDDDSEWGSSGIAFGSPALFTANKRVHTAFITQAGELSVFGENGINIPGFPEFLDGVFYQQPVFDGTYLWLASAEGMLFRVDLSGEILSHSIPGFKVMEGGSIFCFDSSGDKIPEVFITGEGNALYAYSRDFRSLEGFPLPVWGTPVITTIDKKTEIIGMGMDRRLYRWRFR